MDYNLGYSPGLAGEYLVNFVMYSDQLQTIENI